MSIQDLIAFASSDRFLADVTIAMTIALAVLHGLRLFTSRIRPYVEKSPQKWDDNALARTVAVLDGLDAIVDAVSMVVPRPPQKLNRTTAIERVEEGREP